jgi:hypothetical protein
MRLLGGYFDTLMDLKERAWSIELLGIRFLL